NVLAVEIHQVSPTSSDISFDLELVGLGNAPPVISVGGPTNAAVVGTAPNIFLSASATDDDGLVSKVEFYVGNLKLAEDAVSPFSFTWTNALEGSYTVTAVARDNGGARATSAPVNITVFATLVATGSVWKYLDNGSDQGTAW